MAGPVISGFYLHRRCPSILNESAFRILERPEDSAQVQQAFSQFLDVSRIDETGPLRLIDFWLDRKQGQPFSIVDRSTKPQILVQRLKTRSAPW